MTNPEVHKLEKTKHALTLFGVGKKLEFENLCQFIYDLPEKITHQAVRLAYMFWFF